MPKRMVETEEGNLAYEVQQPIMTGKVRKSRVIRRTVPKNIKDDNEYRILFLKED